MSQNSYLREFCAQVSQIVFLADLTVLRFFITLIAKMSQNSYLREFCAQVSQIVSQLYNEKCHKTHILASFVHKYQKSCS